MGVINAEHRHSSGNPEFDHTQNLGVDSLRVVVEVDRINVLVLFRWVLGVGNRTVGASREPLRMFLYPGVVGRGLKGQIHCNFEPELLRLFHKGGKVFLGS